MSEFDYKQHSHDSVPELYHELLDMFDDPLLKMMVLSGIQNALLREETQDKEHFEIVASTDGLTGLSTKAVWNEHLDEMLAKNPDHVAVIELDITNFKKVNDDLTRLGGDEILAVVGMMFAAGFRGYDKILIARLGGDEFGIIVDLSPQEHTRHMTRANRLGLVLGRVGDIIGNIRTAMPQLSANHNADIAWGTAMGQEGSTREDLVAEAKERVDAMKEEQYKELGRYRTADFN